MKEFSQSKDKAWDIISAVSNRQVNERNWSSVYPMSKTTLKNSSYLVIDEILETLEKIEGDYNLDLNKNLKYWGDVRGNIESI